LANLLQVKVKIEKEEKKKFKSQDRELHGGTVVLLPVMTVMTVHFLEPSQGD
jgi:hypothetical protein